MPVIEILLLYYKYIISLRHDETPLFVNWLRPLSLSLSLSLSATVQEKKKEKSTANEMNPVQLRTDNNHFSSLGTSSKSWTPDYLESSARGLY